MSRKWKQPSLSRRAFLKRLRKKQKDYRAYLKQQPSQQPFQPQKTAALTKLLKASSSAGSFVSTWRRTHGHWRCTHSPEPYEWFTRVIHTNLIRSWLIKNNFEFSWLTALPEPESCRDGGTVAPLPTQTARGLEPRATPSECRCRTGTADTLVNHQSLLRSSDDQSAPGRGLEQNGVTTSSLLNCPARAGDSETAASL